MEASTPSSDISIKERDLKRHEVSFRFVIIHVG